MSANLVEATMSPTSDRVFAALALLSRYSDSHPGPKAAPPVSVTISRQAGSCGAEIAYAVGARLGWPVYDNQLLARIAQEKGLNKRLLEQHDEGSTSWLEQVVAGFSAKSGPTDWTYLKHLVELLVSLGQVGHCVIVGRGGGYVLPPATTVRVRVAAPRSMRVAKIQERRALSKAEAEQWVDKTDHDRERFVKSHFNHDPNEQLNYDLILNSGRYSSDECVELIVRATRLREAHVKATQARPLADKEFRS
jgi:cytidylate kinase